MKILVLTACLLISSFAKIYSQKKEVSINTDWYANIGERKYWDIDTLVLFKSLDSLDNKIEIIKWMYLGKNQFRPILLYNTREGMVDPAYMWINKWKLKHTKGGYKLSIIDKKHKLNFLVKEFYNSDTVHKLVITKIY